MLLKEKIPFKYIFGKIRYESMFMLAYTLVVCGLFEYANLTRISIPLTVPAIVGTVLSLLLGFRSNQAYDRWWEARHIWGAIVNDSRSLARQVMCFMHQDYPNSEMQKLKSRIIKRQVGWTFSLGQALRGQNPVKGLDKYLNPTELETVAHYSNIPMAILSMHASDIQEALDNGYINEYQQVELDRTLSRLCDSQGKAERIKNTVFPSTYGLYIHFALMLFVAMLPFGLIDIFGLATIVVVPVIASCFFLIEKMAIHLQDPFENKPTDTPVTTIARTIERDLWQMMLDNNKPKAEANFATTPTAAQAHYYVL